MPERPVGRARIASALGGSARGNTIAILGLTFKPNTDDMREAPSLAIIPALQAQGASIRVHDPKGMPNARALIDGVIWCDAPLEAATGADVVVLTTEWETYRAMDLAGFKSAMRGDLFFDLRNVYKPWEVSRFGFRYFGVGLGDGTRRHRASRRSRGAIGEAGAAGQARLRGLS